MFEKILEYTKITILSFHTCLDKFMGFVLVWGKATDSAEGNSGFLFTKLADV